MYVITSFEALDELIRNAGRKPKVLEALWAGDTQGWSLLFYLYKASHFIWQAKAPLYLGHIGLPADADEELTIEALASVIGEQAAEKYHLTFYFPSPDHPDEDCPKWTERHLAIQCADCRKLVVPTNSSHLPKDICYNCHLARERNEKIRNGKPSDEGINMWLRREREYVFNGYCTSFDSFLIAPMIQWQVNVQLTDELVSTVVLNSTDIQELKGKLEEILDALLQNYQAPVIDDWMDRFAHVVIKTYKGREYELENRYHHEHRLIGEYIGSINTAEKALSEGYSYVFFFKNGFTSKDDAIMRFIKYPQDGVCHADVVYQQFRSLLSSSEIGQVLEKLVEAGCLFINKEEIRITLLGNCIL